MPTPIATGEAPTDESRCRLCDGRLRARFTLRVLRAHEVRYLECEACRSLQTERPYWLDASYQQHLSALDTGAAQRNLDNLAACYVVGRIFSLERVVDFGGGDGLLCRLLRDHGFDCFVRDKYAKPTYGQGFVDPGFQRPDLLTAFEVLEHFAAPVEELGELFRDTPRVVLVSTVTYEGQGPDWWYLAPESGQHVFFFSRGALELVARTFGYAAVVAGRYTLFVRRDVASPWRARLARWLLGGRTLRLVRGVVALLPTPGVEKDHQASRGSPGGQPPPTRPHTTGADASSAESSADIRAPDARR